MNVILPSSSEIDGIVRLLDMMADPKALKSAIDALKKAKKEAQEALDAALAKGAEMTEREQRVEVLNSSFAKREQEIANQLSEIAMREAKAKEAEAVLEAKIEAYQRTCTKDIPALQNEIKKREADLAKREKALAQAMEATIADRADAEALKALYEGKLAQIKALAG